MIDVVIPTLLTTNKKVFSYTLDQLNKCSSINKIIIIDNTESNLFKFTYEEYITDKFVILEPKGNILVNPAWNLGIKQVESDFYLLLNDDILCHSYILDKCNNLMENSNISLLTCSTITDEILPEKYNSMIKQDQEIMVNSNIPNGRIGWFMIGRKTEWIDIPKGLSVFYGDDFIYSVLRKNKKIISMITNYKIVHYESSTINTHIKNIRPIIKSDRIIWESTVRININNFEYKI